MSVITKNARVSLTIGGRTEPVTPEPLPSAGTFIAMLYAKMLRPINSSAKVNA